MGSVRTYNENRVEQAHKGRIVFERKDLLLLYMNELCKQAGNRINNQEKIMKRDIFTIYLEKDYLLGKDKININKKDNMGRNALFSSDDKKSEWLIRNGIEVNSLDKHLKNVFSSMPLSYVIPGYKGRFKIFIDAGVDVNYSDSEGCTALFYANTNDDILTLIEKGVNVNHINNMGENPLFSAEFNKSKILLEHGIDINQLDLKGMNALAYAQLDVAELLINSGISIDCYINNPIILTDFYDKETQEFIRGLALANKEKGKIIQCINDESTVDSPTKRRKRL